MREKSITAAGARASLTPGGVAAPRAGRSSTLGRRQLLGGVLAAAGAAAWYGGPAHASSAQPAPVDGRIRATRLRDGVVLLRGAGGNVVAADAGDGTALMIDGGLAAHTGPLLDAVRAELDVAGVSALVNTHWHPDRTGANGRLAGSGARIIAHENTRLWLGRPISRPWENTTHEPLPAGARPSVTFHQRHRERVGDRRLELHYLLQAHTDGDACACLPESNVLVTGGVIGSDRWPLIDWWTGGWIGGLVDGLDALLALADEDTLIVPGHGEVMTRAQLAEQREMFVTVFNRLANLFFDARGAQEAVAAAPTREFDARFGDAERFVTLAFQSIGLHFAPDA